MIEQMFGCVKAGEKTRQTTKNKRLNYYTINLLLLFGDQNGRRTPG
jgi:hypothetical protein